MCHSSSQTPRGGDKSVNHARVTQAGGGARYGEGVSWGLGSREVCQGGAA